MRKLNLKRLLKTPTVVAVTLSLCAGIALVACDDDNTYANTQLEHKALIAQVADCEQLADRALLN